MNRKAFLDMLAVSEGTFGVGDNGYNVLVGSLPGKPLLFHDYARHPKLLNRKLNSTAAGRYQIIAKTWDGLVKKLGLKDFTPESQDQAALELIRQRGALSAVDEGRLEEAIRFCRKEWASLPGAGYGQREHTLATLKKAYLLAGGTLANH
jgi:muramidase (phage lysozyme)